MWRSASTRNITLPDQAALRRVVVVGTSCSGKTTFARQLAHLLNAPHQELDALYWRPNWTPAPKEEFRDLVTKAAASDRWIMDGNYSAIRDIVWGRATTLIWLNYSLPLTVARALRRTVGRIVSQDVLWPEFSANRETFRKSFLSKRSILLWVLTTYHRRRREFPPLLRSPQYHHLNTIVLTAPRQTEHFLRVIGTSAEEL